MYTDPVFLIIWCAMGNNILSNGILLCNLNPILGKQLDSPLLAQCSTTIQYRMR